MVPLADVSGQTRTNTFITVWFVDLSRLVLQILQTIKGQFTTQTGLVLLLPPPSFYTFSTCVSD